MRGENERGYMYIYLEREIVRQKRNMKVSGMEVEGGE